MQWSTAVVYGCARCPKNGKTFYLSLDHLLLMQIRFLLSPYINENETETDGHTKNIDFSVL